MQIYRKCMYFQAKCNEFKYMEIHIKYMYFHTEYNKLIEKLTIIINIYANIYKMYVFSSKTNNNYQNIWKYI